MKKNMDILIGLSPTNKISIEKELNYIKIGLLYGDNVELSSAKATLISKIINSLKNFEKDINATEFLFNFVNESQSLIGEKPNLFDVDEIIENMKLFISLINKKNKTKEEMQLAFQIKSEILNVKKQLKFVIYKELGKENFYEYQKALNLNMVKLNDLRLYNVDDIYNGKIIDNQVEDLFKNLENNEKYPLYDEEMIDIVKKAIDEEKINIKDSSIKNFKNINFTEDLIYRLPTFEYAKIDEIIDIRKELNKYINNFRGAMITYSEKIESEVWDYDFRQDAYNLFLKEVNPNIQAIDEEVKSNNALWSMIEAVCGNKLGMASVGSLGIMATPLAEYCNLYGMIALGSLGIALNLYKGYNDYKEKKGKIEQNKLFFYYKVGKKLTL